MKKDWQHRYQNAKRKESRQEFSSWSTDDMIDHILELRGIIEEAEKENGQGDKSNEKTALKESDYKQTWSYPTKIAFLLTMHQKPLVSEELHDLLLKIDCHYKDYNSPRNNLTVTLSRTVKSGRIKKIKVPGIRALYYALPEWVDKEGNIDPSFGKDINHFQ